MGARLENDIKYLKKAYAEHKGKWLTTEAVEKYQKLTMKFCTSDTQHIGERKKLCEQLRDEYGVTEIEAINIINGQSAMDYVKKYERIRYQIPLNLKEEN